MRDVLRDELPGSSYDVIYDSGCFHHIAPHRRATYREQVLGSLAEGGQFGIVAFDDRKVESAADAEILRTGDLGCGIGYALADLVEIFVPLQPVETRAVKPEIPVTFGVDLLNAALFEDRGATARVTVSARLLHAGPPSDQSHQLNRTSPMVSGRKYLMLLRSHSFSTLMCSARRGV